MPGLDPGIHSASPHFTSIQDGSPGLVALTAPGLRPLAERGGPVMTS